MSTKVRTYVSQFTIHLGPATTTGQLTPVKAPDRTPKFKLVTPEGDPVTQLYRDDDGNLYRPDELVRGIEQEDGSFQVVDPDAVQSAKKSDLPPNIINLNVHRMDEVSESLFPAPNNAYVMHPVIKNQKNKPVPDPVNDRWYDFLTTIVRESPDLSFMGICNLRNFEGLFKMGIYQGHLMIQKMLYPEDLNQYEVVRPDLSAQDRKKASIVAQKLVTPFDVDGYRNRTIERLEAAVASDFDPATIERVQTVDEFDLGAALDAFVS